MTPMPEQNLRSIENAKVFVERTKLIVVEKTAKNADIPATPNSTQNKH
jgi:hypothetical protein